MRGLIEHTQIALRLTLRNRMALFYGYLLPIIFFLSFLVLYRSENPLLIRHMGELLTVGVLGAACFGLPMTLVSERQRGVWRRFRLTPATTGSLVTGTLVARSVTVLGAGLLQLILAMAIGKWVPAHPVELLLAYSLVMFALLGIGLVLAALADTVAAVQALGQCLFLPMLILGGVAVRVEALPEWILPLTAMLPGRYAVEVIQAAVNGAGLASVGFHVAALLLIGAASFIVGVKLFRWDSELRFLAVPNKSWVVVALASWIVVGGVAIQRGVLKPRPPGSSMGQTTVATANTQQPRVAESPANAGSPEAPQPGANTVPPPVDPRPTATTPTPTPTSTSTSADARPPGASATAAPNIGPQPPAAPPVTGTKERWRSLTRTDFAALPIDQMPPDDGNVSPIATEDEAPVGSSAALLKRIEDALPTWAPGHVPDPVQRVRNYLLLLGVADFAQSPVERFLARSVLTHMLKEFPRDELAQLVCWVALHSDEGDVSALKDPLLLSLGSANLEQGEVRTRTYYYGVKLTRWIVGW